MAVARKEPKFIFIITFLKNIVIKNSYIENISALLVYIVNGVFKLLGHADQLCFVSFLY